MIAFVILHYQAIEETKACIETIKSRVNSEKKIIIVDNCSPNKSGKQLHGYYEKDDEIEVLLLDSNLGFAKGNNIGYREAKKYVPEYIVVMNNDVFIDCDDFIDVLDEIYKETSFDVLGPDIYSMRDCIHQNPQRMENFTYKSLLSQQRFLRMKNKMKLLLKVKYMIPFFAKRKKVVDRYSQETLRNVVLHGACYIYSAKYINEHDNCLYNDTFMYYESYILHALANREGIVLIYDPRIKVLHHEDVATDMAFNKNYSKALFTNKCLLESCNKFIEIINNQDIRIG